MVTRTEAGTLTRARQAARNPCRSTDRSARTRNRLRRRPRTRPSGASAGPKTSTPSALGAAARRAGTGRAQRLGVGPWAITAARRPYGGRPAASPLGQLHGDEGVPISRRQGLHHRMLRRPGLKQGTSGALAGARPAGDLGQGWKGALGGAQIAAAQAEVGVDHADQGEVREVVTLGRRLGGDQDVVGAGGHLLDQGARRRRIDDGVGGEDRHPRIGKQGARLLLDPLHARADGDQAVVGAAVGAEPGLSIEKPVRWQTSRPL